MLKKTFLILLFFTQLNALFALESKQVFTLKDIYQLSLSEHESINQQENTIQSIRAKYNQTKGTALPYVGFVGSEQLQDTSGVNQGYGASSTFTASRKQEYKLTARQSLYSGNRDNDVMKALTAQLNQETYLLKQTKLALYETVTNAYFGILFIQKDLVAIQESMDIVTSRIKDLNYRVRIGRSRQSEVLSSEAQLASLASQKEAALGKLAQAKLALSNLIGIPLSDGIYTEPEPSAPLLHGIQSDTFSTFSSIQALEEKKRFYEYYKLSELHAKRPKLTGVANYYLDRTDYLSPINWDVSLNFEFPLYQGGIPNAAATEYDAYIRIVELELRSKRRAIRTALDSDLANREALLKEKAALELAYKKSKDSYAIYVEEYRLGLVNNLEVLQAASQQLEVKRQLDKALLNIKRNAIQLAIDYEELP